jgi:DNA-binding response OmpR family regulator
MTSGRCYIAVLDDNPPDLLLIQQSIRAAGLDCDIKTFADGDTALAYINAPASRIPDLMILDCNVPLVEGPSILNTIRGNTRWSKVGVLMFTGSQHPGDIARAKLLGADNYIVKPMDLAGFATIGLAAKAFLEKKAASSAEGSTGETMSGQ